MLDRIVQAKLPAVASAYEQKIGALQQQKTLTEDKLARFDAEERADQGSFESAHRTALAFLENPWILWCSERFQDKRAVLKLAFAAPVTYDRNKGYRTIEKSIPFKALEGVLPAQNAENCKMVPPGGETSNLLLSASKSLLRGHRFAKSVRNSPRSIIAHP